MFIDFSRLQEKLVPPLADKVCLLSFSTYYAHLHHIQKIKTLDHNFNLLQLWQSICEARATSWTWQRESNFVTMCPLISKTDERLAKS